MPLFTATRVLKTKLFQRFSFAGDLFSWQTFWLFIEYSIDTIPSKVSRYWYILCRSRTYRISKHNIWSSIGMRFKMYFRVARSNVRGKCNIRIEYIIHFSQNIIRCLDFDPMMCQKKEIGYRHSTLDTYFL